MIVLYIAEFLLFIVFTINILYLVVFSIASHIRKEKTFSVATSCKRMVILIPAYKEDRVIQECVNSCINQSYPHTYFDVVVISDQMKAETLQSLFLLPVRVIQVKFENSTKAKALNFAMGQIEDPYDIALVLDADNTIAPDFLTQVNNQFAVPGVQIVQAHRTAKNLNTNLALLDAVSEEINNSIFRQGHVNLGLSAALIGSGMAFSYGLFKEVMGTINAIGGFDRALELVLLKDRKRIFYLPDAYVLDEKVQYHQEFSLQRRRWLSAQLHYMCAHIKEVPGAIRERNCDFCDKMFQQMSIPRLLLLGFNGLFAVLLTCFADGLAVKWWMLFVLLIGSLFLSIPRRLLTKQLLFALMELPYSFFLMAMTVFRLKGANKKFIHTTHGVSPN
ncbi:MAG: glycosyltransferase [Tannerellaceae bacterium]